MSDTTEIEKVISDLDIIYFNNEWLYVGDVTNRIFVTYSDHYRGNSGMSITANSLHHAHTSYEDRGYIEGVSMDLKVYLYIRGLSNESSSHLYHWLSVPSFLNTKHKKKYEDKCLLLKEEALKKGKEIMTQRRDRINDILAKKTPFLKIGHLENHVL